ncbi:MAG TPA: YciI family protein [Fimbriimonas sp.]|nr:YciI family protein [Fimbriimonas sp.]
MVTLLALTVALQEPKLEPYQLVLLKHAPNPPMYGKNLMAVYQKRHLDRLEDMWQQGTAIAVGPLHSSEYAGLAVIKAPTPEAAKAMFSDDPYVKDGFMTVDVLTWYFQNSFKKAPKFLDIEPVWFGLLETPPNAPKYSKEKSAEIQAGHMANLTKMWNAGVLAIAGPFGNGDHRRGVVIFWSKDEKQIRKAVAEDAAVKAGRLKLNLMQWYTGKGTMPPQPAPK